MFVSSGLGEGSNLLVPVTEATLMKVPTSILILLAALLVPIFASPVFAKGPTRVDGYTRKDGTHVPPHLRSAPNKSYNDNWSASPNVNPYTGELGTKPPTIDNKPPHNKW